MAKDDLIFNDTKIIDYRTAYGKGLEQKIDPRTDYGKGIYYKGDDGREYATLEALAEANRIYWDSMKIDTSHRDIAQQAEVERARMELERKHAMYYTYIGKDGREYRTTDDLERANKAYFDYLNSMLNINDKNMGEEMFRAQQEKTIAYIQERYGSYLAELLEQYGYGQQDNNRGPKR